MDRLSRDILDSVEKSIPITLTIVERRTLDWHYDSQEYLKEVVYKVGYMIVDLGDKGGSFLVPGERLRFIMAASLYMLEACVDAQGLYETCRAQNWNAHWNAIHAEMDAWNWWNECLELYYYCIRWLHRLSALIIHVPSDKQYMAHRGKQYETHGGSFWQHPRKAEGGHRAEPTPA